VYSRIVSIAGASYRENQPSPLVWTTSRFPVDLFDLMDVLSTAVLLLNSNRFHGVCLFFLSPSYRTVQYGGAMNTPTASLCVAVRYVQPSWTMVETTPRTLKKKNKLLQSYFSLYVPRSALKKNRHDDAGCPERGRPYLVCVGRPVAYVSVSRPRLVK
jgi:hypothetical protein